jgi:hypothetical protein
LGEKGIENSQEALKTLDFSGEGEVCLKSGENEK